MFGTRICHNFIDEKRDTTKDVQYISELYSFILLMIHLLIEQYKYI